MAIMELENQLIEQVAARLNWPCVRINLDSHISRIDLIGKDIIVIKEEMTDYTISRLGYCLGLIKSCSSSI